jgi:hypothetical protein
VETMKKILIDRVRKHGKRICMECKSTDIESYYLVYLAGELFPFPYCKKCWGKCAIESLFKHKTNYV